VCHSIVLAAYFVWALYVLRHDTCVLMLLVTSLIDRTVPEEIAIELRNSYLFLSINLVVLVSL
jgi:hypothetical protein